MRILQLILSILFLLFAYFQFNDPDPLIWVSLYIIVAILLFLGFLGKYIRPLTLGLMALCVIGFILTFPGVFDYITNQDGYTIMEGMSNEKPYIEETREFGGLLIIFLALFFNFRQSGKAKQHS